jgi:hypothetical protein
LKRRQVHSQVASSGADLSSGAAVAMAVQFDGHPHLD